MINFHSKLTKSIIIVIFILSLTISIYVVPASAIVTGSISEPDIATFFSLSDYQYFRLRPQITYPLSSVYRSIPLYTFNKSNTSQENDYVGLFQGRLPTFGGSVSIGPNSPDKYLRTYIPIGLKDATSVTIQLAFITIDAYSSIFDGLESNSISNGYVSFSANLGSSLQDINSSVYEYPGLVEYSNSSTSQVSSYKAKVFEITINNAAELDRLVFDFYPTKDFDYRYLNELNIGFIKFYYEGANVQLSNIQNVLTDIEQSQQGYYDDILNIDGSDQSKVDSIIDNNNSVSNDFDQVINDLDVDKPDVEDVVSSIDDSLSVVDSESYLTSRIFNVIFYGIQGGSAFADINFIATMVIITLSCAFLGYILYGKKG